jgi:exoribonuclease-2
VLLKFDKPAPAQLLAEAGVIGQGIELDLAWEFAPDTEFGFADIAREYFSVEATVTQQVGALIRLYEAPHYFRRAGKGRFKKASAETVQLALAGIEKKKQILAQIESWSHALMAGECPAPIKTERVIFVPYHNRLFLVFSSDIIAPIYFLPFSRATVFAVVRMVDIVFM